MFEEKNNYPIVRSINQDESFKPGEILKRYLYHWPLFIICLGICLSLAFVYLKITKPTYEIKASLLIKEDNVNNSNSRSGIALQELNIVSQSRIVDNEVEVLKSRRLMVQLVDDLQLWVDYLSNKKIGKTNLYGESPVKIIFSKYDEKIDGKQVILFIKNTNSYFMTLDGQEPIEYQFDKPVSNILGDFVVIKTDLAKKYYSKSIILSLKDFESTVNNYQKGVEIAVVNKKSPTITLTVVDAVKERGKDVLNHLISIYNIATFAEKNRLTKTTMHYIDSTLISITQDLSDVDGLSEEFKSKRGITDISLESRIALEKAQANNYKLNDINVHLNVVEGIEDYINSSANNKEAPSTVGIDDPGLVSMIAKYRQLELEKSRLLATTPAQNPVFEPLNGQLTELKQAIRINIGNIKLSYQNSKARLESINSELKTNISQIPKEERQLVDILRQQTVKQDLFLYLLKKKEEISLSYASTLADARIIDAAYAGPIKWPNKILILAFAIIAGFGLPVVLLVARRLFNDKLRGISSIKSETDIPVIADVREVLGNKNLIIFDPLQLPAVEQFRFLRTQLLEAHLNNKQGRVTLLTSSIANEGKAFISSNLGLSMAASGRKVVLLDLDFRKNKLANLFDLQEQDNGLLDYLEGKATKEEIVKNSDKHFNLKIITSGESNEMISSELIEKLELELLINWLKLQFDDVIIYAPPVRLVTDAMILSKFSSVILFVVRSKFTKKSHLKFLPHLQKIAKFNQIKIVLNFAKPLDGISQFRNEYYPKNMPRYKLTFKQRFIEFGKRF
jgi:capsular exopolysaccharide synthesis family protein